MQETYVPRDFVHIGQRRGRDGQMYAGIQPILDNGTLGPVQYYRWRKVLDRVVGGVYTGARFSTATCSGLAQAHLASQWPDSQAVAEWSRLDAAAHNPPRMTPIRRMAPVAKAPQVRWG